jgi:hypothetical protein
MGEECTWGETGLVSKKVLILVEGQTEETFCKEVLARHLARYDIFPQPTLVSTRRKGGQQVYGGGVRSYAQIKKDLLILCKEIDAVAITTMLDFYRYPKDAPGYESLPSGSCYLQVRHLEEQMAVDIQDERLIPNLLLHEFEALLFSDPEKFETWFPGQARINKLLSIKKNYPNPEWINKKLPPSKRILAIYPGYQKVLHGNQLALEIGLDVIRDFCPHFKEWLQKLEAL